MRPTRTLGSVQDTDIHDTLPTEAPNQQADSKETRSLRRKISATWRTRSAPAVSAASSQNSLVSTSRLSDEKVREGSSEETGGKGNTSHERTMKKLTQTLGERIPPELVLTGVRGGNSQEMLRRKKLRRKSRSMTEIGKQFGWSKESEEALDEVLKRLPNPSSFPSPPSTALSRSSSIASRPRPGRSTGHGRSNTQTALAVQDTATRSARSTSATYRQGREWSGEWNTDDMASVVQALRMLR